MNSRKNGKIPVGVLASTGSVGQRFIQLLEGHPWFEVTAVTGSSRTIGGKYGEGVNWLIPGEPPDSVVDLEVLPNDPARLDVPIVFSALPSGPAKEIEPAFAAAGVAVLTNASPFRMTEDVPLLIPEVNPEHTGMIRVQQENRNWSGFIVANANCSTTSVILPLKILQEAYGLEAVVMTTLQAISGAGYPGVASLDIIDNVIPHIGGEDAKLEREPKKLLGSYVDGALTLADVKLSAQANRVPVVDGHLVSASVKLGQSAEPADVVATFLNWEVPAICSSLPSSPDPVLVYRHEEDRPQPRRDRDAGDGQAWVLGKVRECGVQDIRFMSLAHNTLRGAASGSVLNAELLYKQGFFS